MAALTTLAVEAEGLAEELLMPLANKDDPELGEMGENGAPHFHESTDGDLVLKW